MKMKTSKRIKNNNKIMAVKHEYAEKVPPKEVTVNEEAKESVPDRTAQLDSFMSDYGAKSFVLCYTKENGSIHVASRGSHTERMGLSNLIHELIKTQTIKTFG